ncbi:hypothetical protein B0H14DRAFT_3902059 [Mycena olivaceomarginata]|nr:hypothetical protein B0H14DRAFT_3902059 [Mycena olivaceomarginata]
MSTGSKSETRSAEPLALAVDHLGDDTISDLIATPTNLSSTPGTQSSVGDSQASILDALVGVTASNAQHPARPPEAYDLFRLSFIRNFSGPGTMHGQQPTSTLDTNAQLAWRGLREQEKHMWAIKARKARAEHAARFPNYACRRRRHRGVKGRSTTVF